MPIFEKYNCFFVHIPRNAGTSVEGLLGVKSIQKMSNKKQIELMYGYKGHDELDHATISMILSKIPSEKFKKYNSFAVVRNPITRLASQYRYTLTQPPNAFLTGVQKSFYEFCEVIYRLKDELENFPHYMVSHYLPQTKFIYHNHSQIVRDIIRFENLEENITNFAKKELGIEKINLANENRTSKNMSPEEVLDSMGYQKSILSNLSRSNRQRRKILDMIYKIYYDDFVNFDYKLCE